ncbi:MAG: TldD/PmbA family protein [candidate division Zixibacteria bacterium]|nr:TldD/PmbA family protein [candidate division Zixibacteria bacterium]
MNNNDRLELARWAIKQAKKYGADDVAININYTRDIGVSFLDRKLDQLTESTQNQFSINVFAGGKYSGHSTNDFDKERLEEFIEEAVAMTKYLGQDPFRSLPDPKYYESQKQIDLKLIDSAYADVTSEMRVKLAKDICDAVYDYGKNIITATSEYGDSHYGSVKVHSNGFEGVREGTEFYDGVKVTIDDGAGGRPSDYGYSEKRFVKELESPEASAKLAMERVNQRIGTRKMASGTYDMLVENRAASKLVGSMQYPLGGSALHRKDTFLDGKLGEKIASDKLTMIDDPLIVSGFGSRLYDGDGMAARKRTIIDKGVLTSYFIDWYYSRKLEMEPTTGGSSNLVFAYGDKSLDQMIAGLNKGIVVTSFIGGNYNSTTGDFSYGLFGRYVESGKIVHPVSEMTVTGNYKELWNQLVEVGNDPYENSSMRRPSLHFTGISFSGV